MADIQPFAGLRPQRDLADKVASPPYDVLTSVEARSMARSNPYSFLHVVKAEIDLASDVDPYSDEVYQKSSENFQRMITDRVLIRDKTSCFYIYQLRTAEHTQQGLVAGVSVDEYEHGIIKKHEFTRPTKENDRARHVEILCANTGPVLITYRAQPVIQNLVLKICATTKPDYDFLADDQVQHTLWVISDPKYIEDLQDLFVRVKALYIADGHHRSASAYRVRNNLRAKNPNHTGKEAYNYFLAVLFPDNELKLMGYHRVVSDLNGLNVDTYMHKISDKFDIYPTSHPEPYAQHHFGMYLDGKWYELVAKQTTFSCEDPVRTLDAHILQENLLSPVLGIGEPRTDKRVDFVGGICDPKELERRCSLDMRVAFTLYPVSVEQLMGVADKGCVMPPKSTWFEPKLRSGLVVRSLVDNH